MSVNDHHRKRKRYNNELVYSDSDTTDTDYEEETDTIELQQQQQQQGYSLESYISMIKCVVSKRRKHQQIETKQNESLLYVEYLETLNELISIRDTNVAILNRLEQQRIEACRQKRKVESILTKHHTLFMHNEKIHKDHFINRLLEECANITLCPVDNYHNATTTLSDDSYDTLSDSSLMTNLDASLTPTRSGSSIEEDEEHSLSLPPLAQTEEYLNKPLSSSSSSNDDSDKYRRNNIESAFHLLDYIVQQQPTQQQQQQIASSKRKISS